MKKAILVVSFGSSHADTREKTIDLMEKEIGAYYPDFELYHAYTSKMIIGILRKRDRIFIPTVQEAMETMIANGIEEIYVQPTHIIDGIENEEMKRDVLLYQRHFKKIAISAPLLNKEEDYPLVVEALMEQVPVTQEEAVVFMGHGSTHSQNDCYLKLEQAFRQKDYSNVFIGTVEAEPTIEDIVIRLKEKSYQAVTLLPFMVVAGDHAKNDMAHEEEESWKTILEKEGFQVSCILKGIGEYEKIRSIYRKHLEETMEKETTNSYAILSN